MKICLWALAFTPLAVNKFGFFPYVTGENTFARGLLTLISILFLINFFYKQEFRNLIIKKIKIVLYNPLVWAILSFVLIFIVSTIFAVNKYNAFWGTLERGEGLIGVLFLFAFFVFGLLIFDRKDWIIFFKVSLLVSFLLLFKEFVQFFGGDTRPSSFLDNPTFLAGHLLFSIFCSMIIFNDKINKFWGYSAVIIFILSILGIFVTQTRGTIVGLFIGFFTILIYLFFKGKNIFYKKINLRKVSIIIFSLAIVLSAVFVSTRENLFWQKFPGVSRITTIGGEDSTTQTRLITMKTSFQSVNPVNNGLKKFLIGWGPDNFSLAYGQYFNPKQFDFEMRWFDRSHNKFLDILVMNGFLGIITFLFICFSFFKTILLKKEPSLLNAGLLLFFVSLLTHLSFAPDQIVTSIPLFVIFSFIVCLFLYENFDKKEGNYRSMQNNKINKSDTIYYGTFFLVLSIFTSFVFVRNDLSAYFQMKKYILLKDVDDPQIISENLDSIFKPFTSAQMNIREDFLSYTEGLNNKENQFLVKLSDTAFLQAEDYVKKNPFDIRFLVFIARGYSNYGKNMDNEYSLKKGEYYLNKLLEFAPNRPDVIYGLALNLMFQKKYAESLYSFEKSFNLSPSFFLTKSKEVNTIYVSFLKYFYSIKDKESFIKVSNRLKLNKYADSNVIDGILFYVNKDIWPNVDFR